MYIALYVLMIALVGIAIVLFFKNKEDKHKRKLDELTKTDLQEIESKPIKKKKALDKNLIPTPVENLQVEKVEEKVIVPEIVGQMEDYVLDLGEEKRQSTEESVCQSNRPRSPIRRNPSGLNSSPFRQRPARPIGNAQKPVRKSDDEAKPFSKEELESIFADQDDFLTELKEINENMNKKFQEKISDPKTQKIQENIRRDIKLFEDDDSPRMKRERENLNNTNPDNYDDKTPAELEEMFKEYPPAVRKILIDEILQERNNEEDI